MASIALVKLSGGALDPARSVASQVLAIMLKAEDGAAAAPADGSDDEAAAGGGGDDGTVPSEQRPAKPSYVSSSSSSSTGRDDDTTRSAGLLLGLTRHVLAPLLRSLGQEDRSGSDQKQGVSSREQQAAPQERLSATTQQVHRARSRVEELERLLSLFAETSAVPEAALTLDGVPEIARAAEECAAQGRRLRLDDLGLDELASGGGAGAGGDFLGRCTAAVRRWEREMSRLTRWPALRTARATTEAQALIAGEGVEPEAASDGRQATAEVSQWRSADAALTRLEA